MRARRHGIRRELIAGIIFIIVLSGAATFFGTLLWSRSSFDDLVQKNDKEFAQSIADAVAPYYAAHGSWSGIEREIGYLAGGILRQASSAEERGRDERSERGFGIPLVIADAQGSPVYSAIREPSNEPDREERKTGRLDVLDGVRVTAGGETVGYVFFKSMLKRNYNPHETAFMGSLAASIGVTSFLGILLALALGSAFAGRFVRPIVALDEAVRKIADGETGVRAHKMRDDEIGNLADNFNVMAEKIEITEIARRNLLADMAHELRTPVSIIQANLEMIIEGVYAPDKARLESLYDETRILTDLIASLREISDLESGVAPMNPHPVRVYPILVETLDKYEPIFAAQDITLALEISPAGASPDEAPGIIESALVLSDEDRLRQVVRNILVNALKYSGAHTAVSMSCARIVIDGKSFFRVTVADGGPGVPETDLEKIFERFYRVDSSRNRDSGGRGLGLSICRQFVEASGGRIFARNRAPLGLEVVFDLPVCDES
jgi:signal transduction histidine kinase